MKRLPIATRLFLAKVAWLWLASMVALFVTSNSGAPNLTTWRNEQWEKLHSWALNPASGENIRLKYCLPSAMLIVSGVLVRLITGNLLFISFYGLAAWAISFAAMRKYAQHSSALDLEGFSPAGLLVFWSLWFVALYAFLIFLTGALMKTGKPI